MTATLTGYEIALLQRQEVAEGTTAFHFEKPEGFAFKPGQAVELLLPDPAGGAEHVGHAFSIVSAPFEDELAIATRMRDSAYKRALKALPIGAKIRLDGPFGSLTLHKDRARAAVFIAGGIGITPFMSIIRQATRDALAQRILLIYSNRRPEDAAFLAELNALWIANPQLTLMPTMTQMEMSARTWSGDKRVVDATLVRESVLGLQNPVFYLAGPPSMVAAMRKALDEAGIDEDDIRAEDFIGY